MDIVKPYKLEMVQTTCPDFKTPIVPNVLPILQSGLPESSIPDDPSHMASKEHQQPFTPLLTPIETLSRRTPPPPMGSGDTMLTAASNAIKIDAPTPKGRNGSIISHLNAQAVAAEERGYQSSSCSSPYREHPLNDTRIACEEKGARKQARLSRSSVSK